MTRRVMTRRAGLAATVALLCAVCALGAPGTAAATTAADLSGRIVIDGATGDWAADEWVIDASTVPPERAGDSQWGADNDVRRVAVTWDRANLYLAVECVTLDAQLLALVDHTGGGVADLRRLASWRRNIVLTAMDADLLVFARPEDETPVILNLDENGVPQRLQDDRVAARYVQFATAGGALEMAIPWDLVRPARGVVSLVAAITGQEGTGAGDAAPDPSRVLESDRTATAFLDRALEITVDADGDGAPDVGVAPRERARTVPSEGPSTTADQRAELAVHVAPRAFAPDRGESTAFQLTATAGRSRDLYVTGRVYSISGRLVRVLYEDAPRSFDAGGRELAAAAADRWDGTDQSGAVVPGGIYLINVTWGAARGARAGRASAAVTVVR